MGDVNQAIVERARRNHQTIVRALTAAKQDLVASLIGVDKSTVTRMKDDQLERLSALLAACRLKVVSEDLLQVEKEELSALRFFAGRGVQRAGDEPSVMGDLE